MHLSEFKAWFEGFTEEMKSPPNKEQWSKIKKRVSEISNDYTPAQVFIDRYWYPYRPYWSSGTIYCGNMSATSSNISQLGNAGSTLAVYNIGISDWTEAGRAEYRAG